MPRPYWFSFSWNADEAAVSLEKDVYGDVFWRMYDWQLRHEYRAWQEQQAAENAASF